MTHTTPMATGISPRRISLLAAAAVGLLATFMVLFLPQSTVRSLAVDPNDHSDGIHAMTVDELPTVTIEAVTDSLIEGMGAMRFRLSSEPAAGADVYVALEAEQPEDAAWLPPAYEEQFSVKIPAGESTLEFGIPVRNLFNLEGDGSVAVRLLPMRASTMLAIRCRRPSV